MLIVKFCFSFARGSHDLSLFFFLQKTVSLKPATSVCPRRVGMTVHLFRKRWLAILVRIPAPKSITIQNRLTWPCPWKVMLNIVIQSYLAIRISVRCWLQRELQSRSVKSTAASVTCAMEPEYHWSAPSCSWHTLF